MWKEYFSQEMALENYTIIYKKRRKTDREKEGTKEGRKKVRKGGKERGEGKSMGGREGGTYKQIILAHNAQYAKKYIYIKPVTKIRYKVGKII